MADRLAYYELARQYPALFANSPDAAFVILLDELEIAEVERQAGEHLRARGLPVEWGRVGVVEQDQYGIKLRDAVRFPDGSCGTYIRFLGPPDGAPGVVVLPVWRGQILLLRHFRHATRTWHLEIPRGFGTAGSSPEENARRELAEEIGAASTRWLSLGIMYPDTGIRADHVVLFYAEVQSYAGAEAHEGISAIQPVPMDIFAGMVADGSITDGFTLAAHARASARGLLSV